MSTGAAPFSPRVLLGMLLFGALAFVATLYFAGAGELGGDLNNGEAHAAANGLNGYAGFAALLGKQGYQVSLSRSRRGLTRRGLVVLTPPLDTDVKVLNRVIQERRYTGPTLVILPKWLASKLSKRADVEAGPGWVQLLGAIPPKWAANLIEDKALNPRIDALKESEAGWSGMGLVGDFPDPGHVTAAAGDALVPLVWDGKDRTLAGYWNDGSYPALAAAANVAPRDAGEEYRGLAPVVIVAEPDLMDNYGLADRDRALLALAIVKTTTGGGTVPVTFDLTLDGLGGSRNLLTLAFTPPFLAASLCLLLAGLVIGWRGYRRFGPPFATTPVFAFGKRQLAVNGAALIQRSRRLHLLAAPYASMLRNRIAAALGLRTGDEAEIDRVLEARGLGAHAFSRPAEALRGACGATDLLRSAQALKQLERNVSS